MVRWKYGKTERWKDGKTEIRKDGNTERQKDGKTERHYLPQSNDHKQFPIEVNQELLSTNPIENILSQTDGHKDK